MVTGNHYLIKLVLLGSIIGGLGLTAPDYVDCKDLSPDEFLDLAFESPHPIIPVLNPHLNTQPLLFRSLRTINFQKANLLTNLLRC